MDEEGSTDVYRFGKSLRKRGFDPAGFAEQIERDRRRRQQPSSRSGSPPGRRWWWPTAGTSGSQLLAGGRAPCPEGSAEIPCGGTHVADLGLCGPCRVDYAAESRRDRASPSERRRPWPRRLRSVASRRPLPCLESEPARPWRHQPHPPPRTRPARATSATSPSWPTSTTARPRWSTPCCGSPAPSASTPTSLTASWTPWTWSVRRASRSWPRTPRSGTTWTTVRTSRSTSSTPRGTPTSVARWSAAWRWSTASCCWSTPARARCRRPGSCCARRCRSACRSSSS